MGLREELRGRRGVSEDDIDDIIEIASRLQDDSLAEEEKRRNADALRDTARELDIDPAFLDAAIDTLHKQREKRAAKAKQQRRTILLVGVGSVVMLGLMFLLGSGVVAYGSSKVSVAQATAQAAEAQYVAVLDRQASLAPQLIAMVGGDVGTLQDAVMNYQNAQTVEQKTQAASALGLALSTALGKLPPAEGEAAQQARLNLQYEITGTQNRISTERRRYNAAVEEWRVASTQGIGQLAVKIGAAEGPP